VIRTGRRTVKNTASYDLTSLFVGSGGTLGFIQEITLHLLSASERVQTFLSFFPSADAALRR
jgi:FAD/FMN-containing dehydrogenase